MAAQGQNFFTASGDNSTWTKTGKSEAWPGDNAYVITVGGTDLVTSGAAGPWASETAWVDSGGGISPDSIAIPSWQQIAGVINSSNRGSTTLRNGPDVSANANFTFYTCADQTSCLANAYGGTSFAAPMWAGYLALVNQQLAANSQGPAGFINPTIYQQNVGSAYATDFHDITSGTSGSYSAVTGYDLVTGWGSPTPALVNALAGTQTQTPDFTIAANPGSVTVTQGSSGNSTISISGIGGFSSAVALSASNMPAGVTVGFNPTSISGSQTSTATFTVASSVQAGTYSITITGTSGSLQHSTTVNLTVSGTQSSYSIAASPTSLTVTRGSSGSSTITLSGTVTGSGDVLGLGAGQRRDGYVYTELTLGSGDDDDESIGVEQGDDRNPHDHHHGVRRRNFREDDRVGESETIASRANANNDGPEVQLRAVLRCVRRRGESPGAGRRR